jgi:aminoglycoside-2''-adenylyltransferase
MSRSGPPLDQAVAFDERIMPWPAWSPAQVATRLSSLRTAPDRPLRWAIAGGWAIDLFLGQVTRPHHDLEITVLADDAPAVLQAFGEPQWRWSVPLDNWLHPMTSPAYHQTHQTWLWSNQAEGFVLDVFRELHDGPTWICRRDTTIRRPWSEVLETTPEGTPYLAPEVVLLFKAKAARDKDVQDFEAALPGLDAHRRTWLRTALEQVHPGHPWISLIG